MKKFKRFVGLAIGAVMMLGTVPPASAEDSVDPAAAGSGTVADYDTEKYYYLNEDFSAYVGGVPAQWQATTSSNSTLEKANDSDTAKGTVLKMPRGVVSSYMNKFETFQSGKLNVEFDIKTSGKGWGVGFIREADSAPADYEKHLAIGNLASDGVESDVYTCSNKGGVTGLDPDTKKVNVIDNNNWNHVSITVDMTSEKYDFVINEGTDKKNTFSAKHPFDDADSAKQDSKWRTLWYDVIKTGTDNSQDSFKCGLNGIRLYSNGTSDVEFDNIKVYSDNSNYISEDFDAYTGSYKNDNGELRYNGLPAGYYRVNDLYNPIKDAFDNTDGKAYNVDTNPTDKGIILNGYEDRTRIRLAQPITDINNNAFAIEFDLKRSINTSTFGLALYPKEKFYADKRNGNKALGLWQDGSEYKDMVIRVLKSTNKLSYGTKDDWTYLPFINETDTTSNLTLEDDNWQHIKLEFSPNTGVTAYLGEGENITKSKTIAVNDIRSYAKLLKDYNHVFGLAVSSAEGGSGKACIDNLKIYPLDSVTKPSVISTKAVMSDNTETDLADGVTEIPNLTEAIEIKFSEPINETADTLANKVTLTDKTGVSLATTRELSEDKKTYTLNLNDVPSLDSYATLKMSSDIKGKSSLAQLTNPVSKALNFKGGIVINSMTLNEDKNKIVISGKNTTGAADNTTYNYIVGIYETIDGSDVLKNVAVEKLVIPNESKFTIEKEIPSINTGQKYKAFIWTAEDNKPVVDAIK